MNAQAFEARSLAAVYDVIASRRDIRRGFTLDPIEDAALTRVLASAHQAPSVSLSGPFTVGRDADPRMAPPSAALAVQNLWLAARAEGIGVGWASFFEPDELAAELKLPAHLDVATSLYVGHVEHVPTYPSRPPRAGHEDARWPGTSMMEPMALVAYLEENLCPC